MELRVWQLSELCRCTCIAMCEFLSVMRCSWTCGKMLGSFTDIASIIMFILFLGILKLLIDVHYRGPLVYQFILSSVTLRARKKCRPEQVDSPSGQVTFHSHLPNGQAISKNASHLPTRSLKDLPRATKF